MGWVGDVGLAVAAPFAAPSVWLGEKVADSVQGPSSNFEASGGGTGAARARQMEAEERNRAARDARTPVELRVPTYGGWSNLNAGESGQGLQKTGSVGFMGTKAAPPKPVNANPMGALRPPGAPAQTPGPMDSRPSYNPQMSLPQDSVISGPETRGVSGASSAAGQNPSGLGAPQAQPWSPLTPARIPQPTPTPSGPFGMTGQQKPQQVNSSSFRFNPGAP